VIMSALTSILAELDPPHREALQWFVDRMGTEIAWPSGKLGGIHLLNRGAMRKSGV